MARTREFDEEKVLEAAMQLFWEKGYEATSLSDLTARMGIQRPSIYSTFGDKKELFEAALRRYTTSRAADIRARLQSHTSVKQAFATFFEEVIAAEYTKDLSNGCFCINTMVELAPHDERFEILTREHQLYLAVIFQETIERGIQSGELDADTDAKSLAQALLVALIGLTVMLKSQPQQAFVDNAIATTLTLLK
ncbi:MULTISPECIES: TetR/AcrR family transcriptional regulator [Lysinibacillus]|jgi:TetR/AcrR family transcriptional repressor of nem operon|uniref:TetR/AcrR family transcriptional regulator n=1 Tax=Lysinibacillus fusiformis TaxID=28031 RepID=A0A2I0UUU7_9BACI|nr:MULTISPECIES: TetR/AcrR family transcriptional regulator [Lysinibacillus]MEE3808016.1 TetR/AcrR family transcriptional regulator [Lysinibacillus fusiformis]PKU49788.1 TetR/AcrR family transcriptional regulator [Lysinibacillus fusiformis]WCH47590.1 TetR/AcrR family transcriptional regulator [Lysinibacillus sp. OF-1]SCY83963.1 transcriptional regulator, TetR family [Lysinibacillus sp. SG9]SDB36537.1 transcriptional regulator, TetR family [Lysinibacillus sp. TC-37]